MPIVRKWGKLAGTGARARLAVNGLGVQAAREALWILPKVYFQTPSGAYLAHPAGPHGSGLTTARQPGEHGLSLPVQPR